MYEILGGTTFLYVLIICWLYSTYKLCRAFGVEADVMKIMKGNETDRGLFQVVLAITLRGCWSSSSL